jgi:hypothetical protein
VTLKTTLEIFRTNNSIMCSKNCFHFDKHEPAIFLVVGNNLVIGMNKIGIAKIDRSETIQK